MSEGTPKKYWHFRRGRPYGSTKSRSTLTPNQIRARRGLGTRAFRHFEPFLGKDRYRQLLDINRDFGRVLYSLRCYERRMQRCLDALVDAGIVVNPAAELPRLTTFNHALQQRWDYVRREHRSRLEKLGLPPVPRRASRYEQG
jgi:hypothetical protein